MDVKKSELSAGVVQWLKYANVEDFSSFFNKVLSQLTNHM